MLVPARTKVEELNDKFAKTAMDQYYKFYHLSYAELVISVEDNFWQKVQLVSLDKEEEVCGYFRAQWSRPEATISSITAINFNRKNPMLFAKDLVSFFKFLLLDLKVKKINFSTAVENPATPHYDSIVEDLGGRVVGIKKYEYLINDEYYDAKMYEIINKRYECDKCGYTVGRKNGPVCKECGKGEMVYINPFGK